MGQAATIEISPRRGAKPDPSKEGFKLHLCACGCGERFHPRRGNQKYASRHCRNVAKNKNWTVVRVPKVLVPATKASLARRKAALHRLRREEHPLLPQSAKRRSG
jgi:hypothetical protein